MTSFASPLAVTSIATGVSVGCTVTAKHSGAVIAPLAALSLLIRMRSHAAPTVRAPVTPHAAAFPRTLPRVAFPWDAGQRFQG